MITSWDQSKEAIEATIHELRAIAPHGHRVKPKDIGPVLLPQIIRLQNLVERIEAYPPHVRTKIAAALAVQSPDVAFVLPPVSELKKTSAYPTAAPVLLARIALGESPSQVTGLPTKVAHEYLSSPEAAPPRWLMPLRWWVMKETTRDIRLSESEVAAWLVARWRDAAQREALLRPREARLPDGTVVRGSFLDRVDELEPADLRSSVTATFEAAGARVKAEIEHDMLTAKDQSPLGPRPPWWKDAPHARLLERPGELAAEGKELQHCVLTYVGKVKKGQSAIVSLRVPDEDGNELRSTAEIDPVTLEVLQHRSYGNREAPEPNRRALEACLAQWRSPRQENPLRGAAFEHRFALPPRRARRRARGA